MRVPIYIDGRETGALTLERRGQWTVADARLEDAGRVIRLTVYGEKSFYLGVPVPEGGGLRLTRKFSPAEAKRLPREPRYAAERPAETETGGGDARESESPRRVLWLGGKPYYF